MNKFWNWAKDENSGERTLYLEGVIAEESWYDDDVTPKAFKRDLMQGRGPITVQIHSPGGDCVAASQIYNMLMDYPSDVTVKIDGLAASAASVIAMAGTTVSMSPTSMLMIHNPSTMAFGEAADMQKAIRLLDEVKESIINAYELKTSLPRSELSRYMDEETWMSAHKAKELGFCDEIRGEDVEKSTHFGFQNTYSRKQAVSNLMNKLRDTEPSVEEEPVSNDKVEELEQPVVSNYRVKVADTDTRLEYLRF